MQPRPPGASRPGVISGVWEQVEALQPGSPLVVTLKSGVHIEGTFKTLGPAMLTLADSAGSDLSLARSDVGRIVARGARDSVKNGLLIGAGVGFGAALAILGAVGSQDGYVLPSAKWGAPLLLTSAGAGVGMLIDRAHRGDKVVYVSWWRRGESEILRLHDHAFDRQSESDTVDERRPCRIVCDLYRPESIHIPMPADTAPIGAPMRKPFRPGSSQRHRSPSIDAPK